MTVCFKFSFYFLIRVGSIFFLFVFHHSPGAFAQVLKIPKFYFEVRHAIIDYLQMMLNKSTFYENDIVGLFYLKFCLYST